MGLYMNCRSVFMSFSKSSFFVYSFLLAVLNLMIVSFWALIMACAAPKFAGFSLYAFIRKKEMENTLFGN